MNFPDNGHDLFSSSVVNGISRARKSGKPFMTGFLTPAQKNRAMQLAGKEDIRFEGGRKDAIRTRLVYNGYPEDETVCRLRASYSEQAGEISHSDILGALMHAGLERDAIGDLAAQDGFAYVICLPSVADYICMNVTQIRRQRISFERIEEDDFPPARFEELKINTASMRSDCIVSALAHTSRSNAKELIRQGFVKINDESVESVRTLCNNDTISVRRCGKFVIKEPDGVSRKGRLILRVLKYQ